MPTENEKENKGNEEIENTGGAADNADNPGNGNETPADAGADDGQDYYRAFTNFKRAFEF